MTELRSLDACVIVGSTRRSAWRKNWQRHQELVSRLSSHIPALYIELGVTRNHSLPEIAAKIAGRGTGGAQLEGAWASDGISCLEFVHMPGVPVRDAWPFRSLNAALLSRDVTRWLSRKGVAVERTLIWVGVPTDYALDLAVAARDAFVVYDVAQLYSQSVHMSPHVVGIEERLIARADLVVCDSPCLAKRLGAPGDKTVVIPQGVSADLLRRPKIRRRENTVGYLGSDNQAFDAQLLNTLATSLPDVSVEVVGAFSNQTWPRNVRMLGPLDHDRAIAAVEQWSVGLVPYMVNDFTSCVLPTKVLEYLAAGLQVVATRSAALESVDYPCVRMAASNRSFVNHVELALAVEPSCQVDPAWLVLQTWDQRFSDLERALAEKSVSLGGPPFLVEVGREGRG